MSSFFSRRALIILLAVVGVGLAQPALAIDDYSSVTKPSAGAMAVDAVLVRPLSFASTIVGSALFVVALPFALLGRNVGQAGERLVVEPGKYTFVRPLGNFEADSPSSATLDDGS